MYGLFRTVCLDKIDQKSLSLWLNMNPKPKSTENFIPEIEGYETIMRSLQAGICRLDKHGTIIYVNDTAAKMLGREKDLLVGSGYSDVFFGTGIDREDPRCGPFEFALREGEISHINTETLIRDDGSEFLSELICVPVSDDSGMNGAVISLIDVTDRRQVEDAVSDARDQALKAARSKADFLANMSHEIRTPLTGILGTVDLLSGSDLDDDQRKVVKMLQNSTELLRGIVNEILEFSKIESGKFVGRREVFPLRQLTKSVVERFRPIASDKNIALSVDISEAVPDFVECDSRSVQQVLNNLLSNALKFTEDGSVSLRVFMGESNDRVKFVVRDTGIGIPDSEKERLFAPFGQADSSDSRRFEGTGLGLAISHRLVRLMGGTLGYDSEEGVGTEFWFEVPFLAASKERAPLKNDVAIIAGDQKPRILVVEDNPVNLEVTLRLLKQIGIEAEWVGNGEDAVGICEGKDFDIVLMDCQMPGVDGYEAARRIRANGGTASILAFTASVNENDRAKIAAAGMNGILRKPFDQNDLIEIINSQSAKRKDNETLDLEGYFREYAISKLIEPKALEQLVSLDTDPRGFLREILGVFVDHFSGKLVELESGVSKLDRGKIESAAHNLKGSSANLGLTKLQGLLEKAEGSASRADVKELEELLYEITLEFGLVRDAVTELEVEET